MINNLFEQDVVGNIFRYFTIEDNMKLREINRYCWKKIENLFSLIGQDNNISSDLKMKLRLYKFEVLNEYSELSQGILNLDFFSYINPNLFMKLTEKYQNTITKIALPNLQADHYCYFGRPYSGVQVKGQLLEDLFKNCKNLKEVDISNIEAVWDYASVIDIKFATILNFKKKCPNLEKIISKGFSIKLDGKEKEFIDSNIFNLQNRYRTDRSTSSLTEVESNTIDRISQISFELKNPDDLDKIKYIERITKLQVAPNSNFELSNLKDFLASATHLQYLDTNLEYMAFDHGKMKIDEILKWEPHPRIREMSIFSVNDFNTCDLSQAKFIKDVEVLQITSKIQKDKALVSFDEKQLKYLLNNFNNLKKIKILNIVEFPLEGNINLNNIILMSTICSFDKLPSNLTHIEIDFKIRNVGEYSKFFSENKSHQVQLISLFKDTGKKHKHLNIDYMSIYDEVEINGKKQLQIINYSGNYEDNRLKTDYIYERFEDIHLKSNPPIYYEIS